MFSFLKKVMTGHDTITEINYVMATMPVYSDTEIIHITFLHKYKVISLFSQFTILFIVLPRPNLFMYSLKLLINTLKRRPAKHNLKHNYRTILPNLLKHI